MNPWTIFDFLDASGENVIRQWIDSQPLAAQVKIDTRIRYLEATQNWAPNYISALKGCDDIYEIRIVSNGVQYRPLGMYGPNRGQFTLLLGTIEKGGKLPKGACTTARDRIGVVNGDRNRIEFHRIE